MEADGVGPRVRAGKSRGEKRRRVERRGVVCGVARWGADGGWCGARGGVNARRGTGHQNLRQGVRGAGTGLPVRGGARVGARLHDLPKVEVMSGLSCDSSNYFHND